MKFAFIAKHRAIWPVAWMCTALRVSRSSFHAWLTRQPSQRTQEDEAILVKARASFVASDHTYGAKRVWRDVLAEGIACGLHPIERIMRENALRARPRDGGCRKTRVSGAPPRPIFWSGGSRPTQRVRGDIADAVEKARRAGEGNKARLLRGVRDDLDAALQEASPGFRDAMGRSAAATREIDAIETGTTAAGRGRTEDKIAALERMTPGEQAAFRTGYDDPLIASVQGAAEGANKARPFTSMARRLNSPPSRRRGAATR